MLYGWRPLNHIQKAETLNLTKASATLLLVVSGCIGFSLLFLFILAAQQQVGIARFFSWIPRSIFGTIPLIPLSLIALLFALLLVSNTRPHSNRYIVTVNSLASTVFGIYLIHQNQSIGQLTWILASKTSPSRPSGMMSMTLISGIILIAVFLILAFIAWIFDNIVVHPIQNTLIHVLEKLMINPK